MFDIADPKNPKPGRQAFAKKDPTPWGNKETQANTMKFTISGGLSNEFTDRASAIASLAPFVPNTTTINRELVATTCVHLGLPIATVGSRYELPDDFYLAGGRHIEKFIHDENYEMHAPGSYVKYFNELPIATLDIHPQRVQNYSIDANGSLDEIKKVEKLIIESIRPFDEKTVRVRQTVFELTDYDHRDNAIWVPQEIYKETIIKPEYYPYVNGGVENLMREFLAADENCMIWYGPPGTGKSSAIRGMVSTMNILPIIAIKASVFSHRNFLRDIFAYSDETMQEMLLETKIKNAFGDSRDELRGITSNSEIAAYLKEKWNYDRNEERKSRIPLIVIEDSDLLISKREDHNSLMAQLLNELDGISSSNGRKIIFTTNKMNLQHVDEALLRPGRCFDKIFFHNLSPAEAAAARAAAGLPAFEGVPEAPMSLAQALAKPRTKFTADANGRFFAR